MHHNPFTWAKIADLPSGHPLTLPFLFLLTTLPIIVFLAFFRQPIGVADEWSHIARAAQLADGTIWTNVAEPGRPPLGEIDPNFKGMVDQIHQRRHEPLTTLMPSLRDMPWTEERVLANYNSSVYLPAPFLISAAAIRYGRSAGLPIVSTLQLVSLWNGIACIFCAALAIAFSPRGKCIIFIVAALPMTMFSFASASPDGPLICSALLIFAFVARSVEQRTVSALILCTVSVLSVVIAGSKLPYLPLVLSAVVTIWLSATDDRPSLPAFVTSLLFVITIPIAWAHFSNAGTVDASWGAKVVDPAKQLEFLIEQPLAAFVVARSTLELNGWSYLQQMVGYLGWLDAPISALARNCLLIMLAFVIILDTPAAMIRPGKAAIAVGMLMSIGAVFLSLYVAFNTVGSIGAIEGVQGRYFLPVLPFIAFLVPSSTWAAWRSCVAFAVVIVAVLVSNFEITQTMIDRYYM